MPEERNLIEILVELAQYTPHRLVSPLIIEYQELMGRYDQNHGRSLGEMYKKYYPNSAPTEYHDTNKTTRD